MARSLRFVFGIASYLIFFVVFVYLIGFVGNLVVPKSVDVGPPAPAWIAAIVDIALIALFGVQHSIMARPGFKAGWTRIVHPAIERSIYVLAASAALVILFLFWLPIPATIWSVRPVWIRELLWALFGLGWLILFISTWLINHFELFGLRQVWADLRGGEMPAAQFREPLFYRHIRHPLYAGFLLAFWAAPDMSAGRLLFAAGMTVYILIGIRYEERDLEADIGPAYAAYRRRVGMLIPGLGLVRDKGRAGTV